MSLILCDSFDYYGTSNIGEKWTVAGSSSIVTGRNGNGLQASNSSQPTKVNVPSGTAYVVGAAVKLSTLIGTPWIFHFRDTATTNPVCNLLANTDGTLEVKRADTVAITGAKSTNVLASNTWYYMEWKFTVSTSIAASSCQVYVNGALWIDVPAGQNIQGATPIGVFWLTGSPIYAGVVTFDDVYLLAQDATPPNNFLGDSKVVALVPTADGNYVSWSFTGGATRWQSCNTIPEDQTKYLSSATPGQLNTVRFGSLATNPQSIAAVQQVLVAEMDDAGPHTLAALVRSSGTDYVQSTLPNLVNGTYAHQRTIMNTNPATSTSWTSSDINAIESGVKLIS